MESLSVECIVRNAVRLSKIKKPALIGVSGCQGSGKTFATRRAAEILNQQGLATIAISIDDFYLSHSEQKQLAAKGNPLLRNRGLPGTHDLAALRHVLSQLKTQDQIEIPQYDKSMFNGEGDRIAPITVPRPEVVLLEGWFVGFRSWGDQLAAHVRGAQASKYSFKDLQQVDEYLKQYEPIWDNLDALIFLKANSLENVYAWRLQQEHALKMLKGAGMSDDAVKAFVDGYMPAYEVYLNTVRATETIELSLDRRMTQIT